MRTTQEAIVEARRLNDLIALIEAEIFKQRFRIERLPPEGSVKDASDEFLHTLLNCLGVLSMRRDSILADLEAANERTESHGDSVLVPDPNPANGVKDRQRPG